MNAQIRERFEETRNKYNVSQARAAKEIGYSAPVLSDYMNNKYAGNIEKLEESIVAWIGRIEQAHARKKVPVVETDQLRKITNAIALAHAEQDIALIVDDAGAGKTTAAKTYQSNNPRATIYIEVVVGMNRKFLTQEIAKQLGLDLFRVQYQQLVQNVAQTLAERNMVVILDEADNLKSDALEFSRRLVNDLGRSGLVFIGLPRLVGIIQNLKNDHRQLESRIGVFLPLSGLSKKDAKKIALSIWPDVEDDIVDAMYRISHKDARQFTKIIERCLNTMALNKVEIIDLDIVETAAMLILRRNWG